MRFFAPLSRFSGHGNQRNGIIIKSRLFGSSPAASEYDKWSKRPSRSQYQRPARRDSWDSKKRFPGRNSRKSDDDAWIIGRNQRHRAKDDGLMGKANYDLDKDALKSITIQDLVQSDNADDPPTGMSSVRTEALAEHRLVSRVLVNSLVHNRKYEWLTPVQAQTILPILRNESVVVRAKTGTGKTAAFVVPTLQKVVEAHAQGIQNKVSAIIISPTRELAQQIADEAYKITEWGGLSHIKVACMVGGVSRGAQIRQAFSGGVADVVVATPGRLMDILDEPGLLEHFDKLQFRVFDEADRLLDIGFEDILFKIRQKLESAAPQREVPLLLFSATADSTVRRFAREQFGDRVRVVDTVPKDEPTANELVDQTAVVCSNWRQVFEGAARAIVDGANADPKTFKAVVFLPTVALVDNFERILRNLLPRDSPLRANTAAIHGQRTQSNRQRRADAFRKHSSGILITTDVVARGMDFPLVSHVYQLGVPPDVNSYVHRIGRTARIGNRGSSVLFYTNHVRGYIDALQREGIVPKRAVFEGSEPDFEEQFVRAAYQSANDEDEARSLVNSLLSYMAVIKSRYHVEPHQFVADMLPFVELYGCESVEMSSANRTTWAPATKRRSGFGSSRKTRMRWNPRN